MFIPFGILPSHNFKKSQQTHKPTPLLLLSTSQSYNETMAHLQSFMSDFLSQYDCSSIYVVSDNARIPQQQEASPSGPVSPRHLDCKPTTRWDSVEAAPRFLVPPVRQISDGGGDAFSKLSRKRTSQYGIGTTVSPKCPQRF
jgi:hypothetical protein